MTIARTRRRWRAIVTVLLGLSSIRLMLPLTSRVHYALSGRQREVSAVMLSGGPQQFHVDEATVDLHIDYPVHVPSLPRFVNVDDRRSFVGDKDNLVHLAVPPASASAPQLAGRVRVISNGVIRRGHECSWKTSDAEFRRPADARRSTTHVNKTLCPLLVPDGHTFQHFVDGVLPKLVQLQTEAPRLAASVDMFVVYRPRDASIYELLGRVGVSRDRLMLVTRESWQSLQVLDALRLVDTCVTPPLHPRLWRRAAQLLRACRIPGNRHVLQPNGRCLYSESERNASTDDPDGQHRTVDDKNSDIRHRVGSTMANASAENDSLIVLLTRRWTRNGGRRLLNDNAVLEYLVDRFGVHRVVRFGNGRVDLSTADRLFSRAAAVVGVHGGAFYNIMLAPRGCVIVELMPLVAHQGRSVAPPRRLAHTVIWRIADALGHTYWRLYSATSSPRNDVTLSIDKLSSALIGVT